MKKDNHLRQIKLIISRIVFCYFLIFIPKVSFGSVVIQSDTGKLNITKHEISWFFDSLKVDKSNLFISGISFTLNDDLDIAYIYHNGIIYAINIENKIILHKIPFNKKRNSFVKMVTYDGGIHIIEYGIGFLSTNSEESKFLNDYIIIEDKLKLNFSKKLYLTNTYETVDAITLLGQDSLLISDLLNKNSILITKITRKDIFKKHVFNLDFSKDFFYFKEVFNDSSFILYGKNETYTINGYNISRNIFSWSLKYIFKNLNMLYFIIEKDSVFYIYEKDLLDESKIKLAYQEEKVFSSFEIRANTGAIYWIDQEKITIVSFP